MLPALWLNTGPPSPLLSQIIFFPKILSTDNCGEAPNRCISLSQMAADDSEHAHPHCLHGIIMLLTSTPPSKLHANCTLAPKWGSRSPSPVWNQQASSGRYLNCTMPLVLLLQCVRHSHRFFRLIQASEGKLSRGFREMTAG